jgi:hypothetical protein
MAATSKLESTTVTRPEDILTPQELSERLKLPVSWIYEKCRTGGGHGNPLPVLRCGRYLRFSWPDVVAWMRSNNPLDK